MLARPLTAPIVAHFLHRKQATPGLKVLAAKALFASLLFGTLPVSAQTLTGFVDMHTHPMSHLAFGGMIVYGAPDTGALMLSTQKYRGFDLFRPECNTTNEPAGNLADALGNCNALHGAPGADNDCGDLIRSAIIDQVEERFIHEYPNPGVAGAFNDHPHAGYPAFQHWPHWSSVTHQQMYWEGIRRAHRAGQRVLVALAVNNSLLAKAGNATQFVDDRSSVELQLAQITAFVRRHSDFMEIARSSRDLRRIVSDNRLAVVLGVETDDFGNLTRRARFDGEVVTAATVDVEIRRLYDLGVRYMLPIHFSNTLLGGYALNKDLFALSSKEYSDAFPVTRETCGEGIQFKLDRSAFSSIQAHLLRTRDLGRIIDAQPTYPAPRNRCGHANALGLTSLGRSGLTTMMNLGMMIDIDHMSRRAADAALDIASSRNFPLNSGHNGPQAAHCIDAVLADAERDSCNENARTPEQYERIRRLRGMVGLGHGSTATLFVLTYRDMLDRMGNRPIAIGTDANGLEPLPQPDPAAEVVYNASFLPSSLGTRTFNFNEVGFAHYGMLPDYIRSWQTNANPVNRMTTHEMESFMSSAEQFARMWERSELRAIGAPRQGTFAVSTSWCSHRGATLHHGDFNGDGAEDLMCRDAGRIWIDYADNRGFLTGATDWWTSTSFCTQTGSELHLGDFNGDGRTDLLCKRGRLMSIDYASPTGRFDGIDWSTARNWCTHRGSRLHLGDLNGDGRTDLLCKDPNRIFVDYADSRGQFDDTDWSIGTTWCTARGDTLHLGDVSGDGRVDMICRGRSGIAVDRADSLGRFTGTDWTMATTFCTHAGAMSEFADANGDGRADWICRDPSRLWIDYADSTGRFLGLDWHRDISFCAPASDQFELMDLNGDGRHDVVCKSRTTLSARYALGNGTY